jgi:hypothetical protein
MAPQREYPGRLIAIDGSRGKDVAAAAALVRETLTATRIECAVSRFDASGLFGELAAATRDHRRISIRTLTLVYAADLAFRLRWEIRPRLEAGGVVIAAPYVDTAIAVGASCGLDREWIRELLRFAPRPDLRARAEERKVAKGWKPRLDRGYAEYSVAMLEASSRQASEPARRAAIALLDKPNVFRLSDKGVDRMVKAVTRSLKKRSAASRVPTSNP